MVQTEKQRDIAARVSTGELNTEQAVAEIIKAQQERI
jgi:hypothetical protein